MIRVILACFGLAKGLPCTKNLPRTSSQFPTLTVTQHEFELSAVPDGKVHSARGFSSTQASEFEMYRGRYDRFVVAQSVARNATASEVAKSAMYHLGEAEAGLVFGAAHMCATRFGSKDSLQDLLANRGISTVMLVAGKSALVRDPNTHTEQLVETR